jgi:hypothetical protein
MTTTSMVATGRDAVAVASARGTMDGIQAVQGGECGLATMREGGEYL